MFFKYPYLVIDIIIFLFVAFLIFSIIIGALMIAKKIPYKKGMRIIATAGAIVSIINPSLLPIGILFKLFLIVASIAVLIYAVHCYDAFIDRIQNNSTS